MKRVMTVFASVLMGVLLVGGTMWVMAQASTDTVQACVKNGDIRIVDGPEDCKRGEAPLQWNVVGPVGPQGPRGVQGPQGPAGADGAAGVDGADGAAAVDGADGAAGADGSSCSVTQNAGSATITCEDGTSAMVSDGATGAQGVQGPQGPQGPQGAQGPQGPQGLQGPAGIVDSAKVSLIMQATAQATPTVHYGADIFSHMFKVGTGQYELRFLPNGRFDSIFDGGLIAVANWYERDCISYIHGGVQVRVHCKDTQNNRMADSAFTFILMEKP